MSATVAGDLEALGFDEIEPGLVEDSMYNRRRIKLMGEGDWDWERVIDEDGELTNLVRVLAPEVVTARRTEVAFRRRSILVDSENPWSDYVGADDYPLDLDLPYWVDQRLQKWRQDTEVGVAKEERRPFPTRCAQLRFDGTRCWLWVNKPAETTKCAHHQRLTNQAVERHPAYARMRLLEASTCAVDNLIYLAENAAGEAVRLKANTEILDRAGVRGGTEIDMNVSVAQADPGEQLQQKLDALKKRHETVVIEEPELDRPALLPAEEPVDAEIVDEETEVV